VFSEEFFESWSYLGIFLGIVATGLGFPMPEELPVVIGGALAGKYLVYWWLMLPVCIVGVIVGDGFLYAIGRLWGPRLVQYPWVKKRLLPPERLERIEHNFHEYGVKILLFARLTPGVRAPIFLTAGITRVPLAKFLLADGIYAIPGVSLLFFLGYWFTEGMVHLVEERAGTVKYVIILIAVVAVAAYFAYRYFRRPVVTGGPEEMPPIVEQVTTKILLPKGHEEHRAHHPPEAAKPSVNGERGETAETRSPPAPR
jgi:membrane protein DedA with SNARE-associated domain